MSISTRYWSVLAATGLTFAALCLPTRAQNPSPATAPQAPATNPDAKPDAKPDASTETPAQIELLETKIRFESNGDSRKEVHTRVRINSELGARQFAHLNFNFNRAYEKVEIPLVHITHKSGGSADILPSAITDLPDPLVADAPTYQDIRVKSVRILGLEPSDILEYRVITTTEHGESKDANNFWLDHSFDRTGVVTREVFSLDLPAASFVRDQAPANPTTSRSPADVGQIYISPETHESSKEVKGSGADARLLYLWDVKPADLPGHKAASDEADVVITTYSSWEQFQRETQLGLQIHSSTNFRAKAQAAIQKSSPEPTSPNTAAYNLVSAKIRTVELPLDLANFGKREDETILSSGVATPEDKIYLLRALLSQGTVRTLLVSSSDSPEKQLPRPSLFIQILLEVDDGKHTVYLDPSLEVAPFGMIRPDLRGKKALDLSKSCSGAACWKTITGELPFSSTQRVNVDATIAPDGTLNAKVKYTMRGDNELLLRLAFHQSPRDKWKDVAQLMSLSDGFRGKILSASASNPVDTRLPFSVEYEISQPKFVDWSKKPVRIAAPLPVLTVPDLPGKVSSSNKTAPIDLGTPLDVQTRVTLHLPAGTSVELPTGTVVDRDYATFASRYNTDSGTITATRHINFLRRQVNADRAPDYAAFLHAVQTDQAQLLTLTNGGTAPQPTTAANKASSPNRN
jgi:hypothetical protein